MFRFLIIAVCLSGVIACDSPRNHRVSDTYEIQNKLSSMSFDSFKLNIEAQWLVGPVGNINTDNQLLVIVKDEKARLTSLPEGFSLDFYATMTSMGHPLDDPGFFEEVDVGIYINKSIRYNMPGDWKNELWIMDSEFNIKDKVIWDEFF